MAPSQLVFLSFFVASFSLSFAQTCGPQLLLPKPNGPYEVSLGIMELVDSSRLQPFAPGPQPRNLMVSCFYPANPNMPTTSTPYMDPVTALFEDENFEASPLSFPNGTFESLALSMATKRSRYLPSLAVHPFPVVLFSPAEGTTRLFYSTIASTIASQGYIVITIDAPYDVDIVVYPNSATPPAIINATDAANAGPAEIELATLTRAQDASFVLDQLANTTVVSTLIPSFDPKQHPKGLNTTHAAMFGHSLGGAAAASAMLNDTRIRGGLAMDGALWGPVVEQGLDRPFMFLAHAGHLRTNTSYPTDPYNSWYTIWPKLKAFKLDLIVANTLHYDFSDLPIVFETLDIVLNKTVAEALLVTDMPGTRALQIVTTYVGAFLDHVLKNKTPPLLQGPSKAFPEVTFDR